MIPRKILKTIRQIEIRTNLIPALCLALVLSSGLFGCSTTPKAHVSSAATEWFPTLGPAAALDDSSRQNILKKCGVKEAKQIWTRTLDLDRDNIADCVVTISLPDEMGPYWTNYRSVTYVFRGRNGEAFGGGWEDAALWFSLVTYEGQDHVRYGDAETVRQFSIFRHSGSWFVTIGEREYGNDGGEARERFMKLRRSQTRVLPPSQMPPAKTEFP